MHRHPDRHVFIACKPFSLAWWAQMQVWADEEAARLVHLWTLADKFTPEWRVHRALRLADYCTRRWRALVVEKGVGYHG